MKNNFNQTVETDKKEIAYLGPEGSYTGIAADIAKDMLNLADFRSCKKSTIREIIDFVDINKGSIGVIPIENSIEGLVRETVDPLIKVNLEIGIFQEIVLPICHCLITKGNDLTKMNKIISHPQALAQCQNYIHDNFISKKNIEIIKSHSTSKAVSDILDLDETYAAIGNKKAAEIYNLNVQAECINDEKDNKTRFVCIGYQQTKPTGFDRTSIAFTSINKPGALVDILNIFKQHDINMSCIDSRPSKKFLGEYTFHVDLDGHVEDEKIKLALNEIKPYVQQYRLIGSYPKYR